MIAHNNERKRGMNKRAVMTSRYTISETRVGGKRDDQIAGQINHVSDEAERENRLPPSD